MKSPGLSRILEVKMRISERDYQNFVIALDILHMVYKTGGRLKQATREILLKYKLPEEQEQAVYRMCDFYIAMKMLEVRV